MKFPAKIQTESPEETERFGRLLAEELLSDASLPRFVALYGDLGVGKTAFVRGFTSVVAPKSAVKSPTFAMVHEYRGETTDVFHFDMYRISDEDDLYSIGFYDYWDRNGICLCEWRENIEFALPDAYFRIEIRKCPESGDPRRRIILADSVGFSAVSEEKI